MKLEELIGLNPAGLPEVKIRQSYVGQFLKCPEALRLNLKDRLNPDKPDEVYTESFFVGTGIHLLAEQYIIGQLQSMDDVYQSLDQYFQNECQSSEGSVKGLKDQILTGFRNLKPALAKLRTFNIENPHAAGNAEFGFDIPLVANLDVGDGETVSVSYFGRMDFIDRVNHVIYDFKSSTSSWKRTWWEKDRYGVQHAAYSYAYRELYESLPSFTYLVGQIDKLAGAEIYNTTVSEDAINRYHLLAIQVARLIYNSFGPNGDETPWPMISNGWWCSNTRCFNFNDCPINIYVKGEK